MTIIRVYYKHQKEKDEILYNNHYVDFPINRDQEDVISISLMDLVPEHFITKKVFEVTKE